MCLKRLGCRVTAVDIDEKAICWAKEHGVIDEGTAGAPEALLAGADVVVLGLYPGAMVEWVRAHAAHLRPGTLLTDVCGVKGAVVGPVQALLPPGVEFIACHPMACLLYTSNGMPLVFRTAVKPTASIYQVQQTVDWAAKRDATLLIHGRHDPCIAHRARAVQDAVTALAVADLCAQHFGKDWQVAQAWNMG